ncbi:MAG: winged helix-turn-helix transcriptional regulator [Nitriliruptoraceae bacterium]|nr:winged helix-turn-helix transcriptional regulator [Nitriliruptoraceae bacterium]
MASGDQGSLPHGRLAAELLTASAWFDQALRTHLAANGWPPLSATRSRIFLALSRGPVLVSDLAAELDVSRQAVHKLLDGLQRDGLVERRRHERDRRAHQVLLTERGRALARDAGRILPELEQELARRIGADHVQALRDALGRDRGPAPVHDQPVGQPARDRPHDHDDDPDRTSVPPR